MLHMYNTITTGMNSKTYEYVRIRIYVYTMYVIYNDTALQQLLEQHMMVIINHARTYRPVIS